MSKKDQPAVSSGGRTGVPVRLSDDEKVFASELGDSIVAKGVRRAIKAASILGLDAVLRLAGPDSSDEDPEVKRGPGRPKIGAPIIIRLSQEEFVMAKLLGDVGDKAIVAVGARRALRACSSLGADAAKRIGA
jgi:hypothetical protein